MFTVQQFTVILYGDIKHHTMPNRDFIRFLFSLANRENKNYELLLPVLENGCMPVSKGLIYTLILNFQDCPHIRLQCNRSDNNILPILEKVSFQGFFGIHMNLTNSSCHYPFFYFIAVAFRAYIIFFIRESSLLMLSLYFHCNIVNSFLKNIKFTKRLLS
jgi:hypothetical protein